jgi:hypothetical protein
MESQKWSSGIAMAIDVARSEPHRKYLADEDDSGNEDEYTQEKD